MVLDEWRCGKRCEGGVINPEFSCLISINSAPSKYYAIMLNGAALLARL